MASIPKQSPTELFWGYHSIRLKFWTLDNYKQSLTTKVVWIFSFKIFSLSSSNLLPQSVTFLIQFKPSEMMPSSRAKISSRYLVKLMPGTFSSPNASAFPIDICVICFIELVAFVTDSPIMPIDLVAVANSFRTSPAKPWMVSRMPADEEFCGTKLLINYLVHSLRD